jgi:hypothetical protein
MNIGKLKKFTFVDYVNKRWLSIKKSFKNS